MTQRLIGALCVLCLAASLQLSCGGAGSPLVDGYTDPGPSGWDQTSKELEIEVVELVNKVRLTGAKCGDTRMPATDPVQMAPPLQLAARLHSEDMVKQNYFSHTSKDKRSPSQRMKEAGATNLGSWGENIARGSSNAAGVMSQWMNSSGHCKNIMNKSFKFIGLGKNKTTWTMTLATRYQ